VWLADISYIPTDEGFLYLAALKDLATREIVGWSMADHLKAELCVDALVMALQRCQPPRGLIHHSDRGVQYASGPYRAVLERHGIQPSMSRRGNCLDNAPMESFFASLKTERVHEAQFRTLRGGKGGGLRVHRGVLQSAAAALGPGLSHPSRGPRQHGSAHHARCSLIF
jgi:transposase InsO family protein